MVVDSRTVRFEFARVNPELHLLTGEIPVFSHRWGAGKPFDKIVTDPPLGSGPYRVGEVHLGKRIGYVRNPDYWGRDLNVRRGVFNFDRVNFIYYQDGTVELEAFKAGEFDFVLVSNSKQWARDYKGPKFDQGLIKKAELKNRNDAGMQGFAFNVRRELFRDRRVRRAIDLALDFERCNRNLFYGQYQRCDSYFSNSELASSGIPQGDELKLLEPYRSQLPPELFTRQRRPPSTEAPGSLRANLREAKALLQEAGWSYRDGALRNGKGEPFVFEMLLWEKGFERIVAPFARNLAKLGIVMNYRTIDVALYQHRSDTFDFDMMVQDFPESQSPGNEQINYWHSSAADKEGSNNVIGIKDPGGRRHGREAGLRPRPEGAGDRHPCPRPGVVERRIPGAQLVRGDASRRLLGQVRLSGQIAPVLLGAGMDDAVQLGKKPMIAYILKRLLLMIPTLFGVLAITFAVIQFVPGGPVEQLIHQIKGQKPGGEAIGDVAGSTAATAAWTRKG